MKLDCPTCGHSHEPTDVNFNDEVIVSIDDRRLFNEITQKIGGDWFKIPSGNDREDLRIVTVARLKEYLTEQTDLLTAHNKDHWDNVPRWNW